jgi:hypothetical protein
VESQSQVKEANSIAHETQVKGGLSELKAREWLMRNGWEVAKPEIGEVYDIVAKTPVTNVWVTVQVKTIRQRDDREGNPLVIYAKKNNGNPYSESEVDFFIGVHGDDVYLLVNRSIGEYWRSENPKKGFEWWRLNGDPSEINPLYTSRLATSDNRSEVPA